MKTEIKWSRFSYVESQLRTAVSTNISARSAMRTLGLTGDGAGYKPFLRVVRLLNLDTSHWLGQAHYKGKTNPYPKPIELKEILVQNSQAQSFKVKNRLLKEHLLEYRCYNAGCGIAEWLGQTLSLQLDHINGQATDNRLENLRLLCPNCHSQTTTFAGRNKRKKK